MTMFAAMLLDAYRELNAKKLFWITLAISGLVVLSFGSIGFDEKGMSVLFGLKHIESSIRPAIWQPEGVVDEIIPVSTEDGWDESERLLRDEGLAVGHSGGAAAAGAIRVAERLQAEGEGGSPPYAYQVEHVV